MDPVLLVAGVAIGLAVAAPLGPVNIIVIRTALRSGSASAFLAGLGAVIADGAYATVAAYGLRSVEALVANFALPLTIAGGVLLVVIGIRTARKHVSLEQLAAASPMTRRAVARISLTTFTLTAMNPATLFGFLAIFGAMSPALQLGLAPYRPLVAVLGVVMGGILWWGFISAVAERLKQRLAPRSIDRINRWTGVLVAAFGFALLMDAVL